VGVYVGIFSLAKTKLPSYVTPAYPALALMTACFIDRWTRGAVSISRWWPRFAFGALVAVGAMMAVGLPLAAGRLLPGEQWLGLIGVVPILGGIAGLMYVALGRLHSAAVTYAATAVALTTAIFGLATVRVDRHQQSHVLLRAIDDHNGQVQVGSFACLEPSWVFYGGRPIYELVEGTQDDAAYAVSAQGQAAGSSLAKRRIDVASFLAAERQPFVITTRKQWQRLRSGLPGDLQVIAAVPYFLKKDQLVLIGRAPRRDTARDTNERLRDRIHENTTFK
jgi:4-amino-4-deoxy-L-arabinose transferase-like glycosyltransferase